MSKRQKGSAARAAERPSDPWGSGHRSFIRSRRAGAAADER